MAGIDEYSTIAEGRYCIHCGAGFVVEQDWDYCPKCLKELSEDERQQHREATKATRHRTVCV
jgi:predicted amidophosphoribosyltransferase